MFGRRAAILADQLEAAGLVRTVRKHPPHQPAVDDRQILAVARRQRQHLAWPAVECARRRRRRRHRRDRWRKGWAGSAATAGSAVSMPGRRRRQIQDRAARRGASGIAAGGTGGGRSENICADAGVDRYSMRNQREPNAHKRQRRERPIRPARSDRYRYPSKSWACFSLKTRQIQACRLNSRGDPGAASPTLQKSSGRFAWNSGEPVGHNFGRLRPVAVQSQIPACRVRSDRGINHALALLYRDVLWNWLAHRGRIILICAGESLTCLDNLDGTRPTRLDGHDKVGLGQRPPAGDRAGAGRRRGPRLRAYRHHQIP